MSVVRMSGPQMVTQPRDEKVNPDRVYTPMDLYNGRASVTSTGGVGGFTGNNLMLPSDIPIVGDNQQMAWDEALAAQRDIAEAAASIEGSDWSRIDQMTYRLTTHEELASLHPTQAVPYLQEYIEAFERSRYEALEVPYGVVMDIKPFRADDPKSKVGSKVGGVSQSMTTAYQMWSDAQRNLRSFKQSQALRLLRYMTRKDEERLAMLLQDKGFVASWTRAQGVKRHVKARTKKQTKEICDSVAIELCMPSLPDDGKVLKLYELGVLSLDYLKHHQSINWDVPVSAFLAKPELTIPELHGILPEPKKPPKKK